MKPIVQSVLRSFHVCLVLFGAWRGYSQGALQVVVPAGLANVEGNSSTSDPFTSSSFRFQQVFDSSQFAFLGTGTGRIDGISFRIDGASTLGAAYSFGGSTIQLSTTTRSPDGLSPVFADNIGANVVTVFNGGLGLGNLYTAGASPQPFNQNILVATGPFFYVPSQGNLLLDIRAGSGQLLFPGSLDAQSVTGDSISRVFALSNLASSGTADSLGLVARFNFVVVPEPSTWLLLGLGFSFVACFRRR